MTRVLAYQNLSEAITIQNPQKLKITTHTMYELVYSIWETLQYYLLVSPNFMGHQCAPYLCNVSVNKKASYEDSRTYIHLKVHLNIVVNF